MERVRTEGDLSQKQKSLLRKKKAKRKLTESNTDRSIDRLNLKIKFSKMKKLYEGARDEI